MVFHHSSSRNISHVGINSYREHQTPLDPLVVRSSRGFSKASAYTGFHLFIPVRAEV